MINTQTLEKLQRKSFLLFWYLISKEIARTKLSKPETTHRLVFIRALISFNDAGTKQEQWRTDRFAAFREIFEELNKCCAKNMSPHDYIPIDEKLYPTRGGISFKTYNKDKPTRYYLNLGVWTVLGVLMFIILYHTPESK